MSINGETSIVLMTKAALMLSEANTVQKAKELKDLALTAKDWATRKGLGDAAIQHARFYALEAERRMGELLAKSERAKGAPGPGRGKAGNEAGPAFTDAPTLADLGLTKNESSRAQMLASVTRDTFEEVKSGDKTIMEIRRELKRQNVADQPPMPDDKFRVIYADPPWKYGDTREGLDKWARTAAEDHYPTMSISDLCALPVKGIVADDAVLFMWVTSPLLAECWPVITAWGFKYKASFIWDKVRHNFGHYNSVRHEILLVCTRGSCLPDGESNTDSVISIERNARHSEKPGEFISLIESMYKTGKKIELFSRAKREGWESWGNEVE